MNNRDTKPFEWQRGEVLQSIHDSTDSKMKEASVTVKLARQSNEAAETSVDQFISVVYFGRHGVPSNELC